MNENDKEDSILSKYYYRLGDAVDEVSLAYGAKETAVAGVKLAGKTLFNTALFSGKLAFEVLKNTAEKNKK